VLEMGSLDVDSVQMEGMLFLHMYLHVYRLHSFFQKNLCKMGCSLYMVKLRSSHEKVKIPFHSFV